MVHKVIITANGDMKQHRFCDVCGKEIDIYLTRNIVQCRCCGKDLCKQHIVHKEHAFDEEYFVYCKNCWEIGKLYNEEIKILHNKIDILYEIWQDKCKVNIKV